MNLKRKTENSAASKKKKFAASYPEIITAPVNQQSYLNNYSESEHEVLEENVPLLVNLMDEVCVTTDKGEKVTVTIENVLVTANKNVLAMADEDLNIMISDNVFGLDNEVDEESNNTPGFPPEKDFELNDTNSCDMNDENNDSLVYVEENYQNGLDNEVGNVSNNTPAYPSEEDYEIIEDNSCDIYDENNDSLVYEEENYQNGLDNEVGNVSNNTPAYPSEENIEIIEYNYCDINDENNDSLVYEEENYQNGLDNEVGNVSNNTPAYPSEENIEIIYVNSCDLNDENNDFLAYEEENDQNGLDIEVGNEENINNNNSSIVVCDLTLSDDEDDDSIPTANREVRFISPIDDVEIQNINEMMWIDKPVRAHFLFPEYGAGLFENLRIDVLNRLNSDPQIVTIFCAQKWLPDSIINNYFKLLEQRSKQKIVALDSFFMHKLEISGSESMDGWNKSIDFFSKEKILVPVHLPTANHWVLLIADIKSLSIYYYDSFGTNLRQVALILVQYLCEKYNCNHFNKMEPSMWKILSGNSPYQENYDDCGVFVCVNAEMVSDNRPLLYTQDDIGILRHKITYELINKKLVSFKYFKQHNAGYF